jgi:hypothetical protein
MLNREANAWYDNYELKDRMFVDPTLVRAELQTNGHWQIRGSFQHTLSKQSIPFEALFTPNGEMVNLRGSNMLRKKALKPLMESVYWVWRRQADLMERQKHDQQENLEMVNKVPSGVKQMLAALRKEAEEQQPLTRADIEDAVRSSGSVLDAISSDCLAQIDALREIKGLFSPATGLLEQIQSIYQQVLQARQVQLEAERGLTPSADDTIN